ncbi:complement C3-like [Pempheris klunzingeri]|uniref:complement C3-like n=1 Tax=Pempheris klunzingeri TaxID=3127111 RepID=UPI00398109BB
MCGTQLWLLASLAFSSLTCLADGSPMEVMSAPSVLQVGTPENIFVECQDCTGGDIRVDISVMNHPTKIKTLASTFVTLTSAKHFQGFGQIKIPVEDFNRDPNMKQYVYLQAKFPDRLLEKVVLVSFQYGYIFIQTDKTIYTPNSRVHFRLFAVTPRMEPVEFRTQTVAAVAIEIETPDSVILPLDPAVLKSGIYSGDYQLNEIASPGLWKVVAKFQSNPQHRYSAEFEVKEYVLPSFEVKLTPQSSFFYVDSQELTVNIKATYMFGEEVDGMAYAIFGVMHEGQKKSFPSSVQRVPIVIGDGAVTLRTQYITETFKNISDLVGSLIFLTVSVLTVSGSEMAEAELRGIPIVTSPYIIRFKKTPKYFKPEMSLDVVIEVVNPGDGPAKGVAVVVDPGQVHGYTTDNGMTKLTINTDENPGPLTITAWTAHPHISSEKQATATMVAHPYTTKSNNYIYIGVDTVEVTLGDNLKIRLILSRQEIKQNDITYLIVSRGQLVKYGRYQIKHKVLISLTVPITKEMLPSFRIIAYYHTDDNEVVSDSVWVDVKDSCLGSLKLESTSAKLFYHPRKLFHLKVTGDPEATVGLVAVDKNIYVQNNRHRLTQKKVWDLVEKFDTGCTPGGGKDSMGVFYDAGLLFKSSAAATPNRQELKCPTPSRMKRDSLGKNHRTLGEDDSYMDSYEIVSRTSFPENWLWADIKLPRCPRQTPNCDTTSVMKYAPLKDSLTTWQFIGISLSRTNGICVADPLEVTVRKEFFIDLRLPYSAVRGEQLEIKAILHNYSPDLITVKVVLFEELHVCSAAYKRGKYVQEVGAEPLSTRSVPFIITPMKEGQYQIEVKAAVKDSFLSDGIRKILQVVPRGVLMKSSKIITLDPTKKGVDGKQEEIINSESALGDMVPRTPVSTVIFLTGREQILSYSAISGSSLGALIKQPSGSGEGNIANMTEPVIATMYLDKTNQWESVGFEKRNEAIQHIKTGYLNELAFRKSDGSFSVWTSHQSSTWLTAYVAKVFAMAHNLIAVQSSHICDAVKFLILNTQQSDGMFREVGTIINREMIGDVCGTDSDASMTAFCLIAMQESRTLCAATVNSLPDSVDKAVAYLEKRLPSLTNPFAVAMTSYALANENKLNQEILFKFASPDLSHWPVAKGHFYTLEATAYALLALVKAEATDAAGPIARWLNQQQLQVDRGLGEIQATIMVYQAVAEYWTSVKEPEYDLDVSIFLPDRSRPDKFRINMGNYYATRISRFNSINKDVRVIATGKGEATLKMVSLHYAMPKEKENDCHKFNLTVQLSPEKMDEDEKIYKLKIEVLFMDQERDATMSVLDIGLLTGFIVNTKDLDQLAKGPDYVIAKYEMNTVLSERASLIIYLDKVSHTRPQEINFRIHQILKVGVLQPAAVSVYEYYDQTPCMKFYHTQRRNGELLKFCKNDECTCAEEDCSMQKKDKISNDDRILKACDTRNIDFVYKVRMENFTEGLATDMWTARIMAVTREGNTDLGLEGKLRTFFGHPHCRSTLDLRTDKTYLIMGTSKDIHKDEFFQYFLGEGTWIEYWPTEAECQTEEHRSTCLGLQQMVLQQEVFGCQQ